MATQDMAPKEELSKFLKEKFEHKTEKKVDIVQFNNYNPEIGLKLTIEKIYGLGSKWDTKYFQVLSEVIDLNKPEKSFARVLSQNLKMKSMVRSPVWEDELFPIVLASPENKLLIFKIYNFTDFTEAISLEKQALRKVLKLFKKIH